MFSLQAMSTTAVETWAGTDLTQLGPIYPFVGTEVIMVIIGVVLWIAFHVLQIRDENREFEEEERLAREPERVTRVFKEEATGR